MAEVRETSASIVIVGNLNPLIFQPEWLRNNNLIGEKEAEEAREGGIEAIHPEITSINLSSMKLQVEQNRFFILQMEEPLIRVRDFALGCFNILSHTPVVAVGLNFTTVFRSKDVNAWHRFGDKLAPKEHWGNLLQDYERDHPGGLRSMTMERYPRHDGRKGYTRMTVEAVNVGQSDTRLQFNDHFDIGEEGKSVNATSALKLIDECWEGSLARSRTITRSLMELADAV